MSTSSVPIHKIIFSKEALPLLAVMLLAVFVAYLPVLKSDFIYLDDDSHLLENPAVRVLDLPHIQQMFTMTVNKIYIPLTLLSFALEYHFFKYTPLIYHLNNLLLHMAVTALVFGFALQVGLPPRAAFAAGLLFGIHPMHVESVAWVTERKDVLYSLFYMLALCSYWQYLAKRDIWPYIFTIAFGVLSILAKPMALSLPLIFGVCDWFYKRPVDKWVFWDKVPHLLYIVPIAWITYSLNARIPGENIVSGTLIWIWSSMFYIQKFLWPATLVPMYVLPKPVSLTTLEYGLAIVFLAAVVVSLLLGKRNRWLWFAALFYFFSMFFLFRYDSVADKNIVADRFMYLPCLGICFLIGWGIDQLYRANFAKSPSARTILSGILAALALVLCVRTFTQAQIWQSSIPFWSHVIKHDPQNAMAYGNRGEAYKEAGDLERAMADFNASIAVDPKYAESYNSRGQMHGMQGQLDEALRDFEKAIALMPRFDEAHNNMGIIYSLKKDMEKALLNFQKAAQIDPNNVQAHFNLGEYYLMTKDLPAALARFQRVIDLNPHFAAGYHKRGIIFAMTGKYEQAARDFRQALMIDPNFREAKVSQKKLLKILSSIHHETNP